MKIVLIGQAAFGAKVLEAMLDNGEDVTAVYAPIDKPGGKEDFLKEKAQSLNIQVLQPSGYDTQQVFEQYQSFTPDLTVMAFVTDIIPARFFNVPNYGAINFHPSLLPRHRGASAINWAVIMGDDKTGLTVFWPDGGIDTGPILLQKEVPITQDDTTGSLYFDHIFPLGVQAMLESVNLIKNGQAPKIPQDENQATYEPPCNDKVAMIEWNKPDQEIDRLVRGCDPQPGSYVLYNNEKIRLYQAKIIEETPESSPGTIIQIYEHEIQIALSKAKLNVGRIRAGSGNKISAAEFVREKGFKQGDKLEC